MKFYEVVMHDTNTGIEVRVDIEADTKAQAEKAARGIYGRPGLTITATTSYTTEAPSAA